MPVALAGMAEIINATNAKVPSNSNETLRIEVIVPFFGRRGGAADGHHLTVSALQTSSTLTVAHSR